MSYFVKLGRNFEDESLSNAHIDALIDWISIYRVYLHVQKYHKIQI